jgi:hypothetical protein
VELSSPLFGELSLSIADFVPGAGVYPVARLQKGLLLLHSSEDLVEEGVGFGVPILKQGARTIFPGRMELRERREGTCWEATATYEMNLVERLAGPGGSPAGRSFYALRDALAALHRRCPPLRATLTTISNTARRRFAWVTTFEETQPCAELKVTYSVNPGQARVHVAVDLSGLPAAGISEVVVMNELGARHFNHYSDSNGTFLRGAEIGTWSRVAAAEASLRNSSACVAFSLRQVEGARLYRGRELVGSRLAWSGFGYSLEASAARAFDYDVSIERIP